jgi:UDPglucose 6-dehydrogenase
MMAMGANRGIELPLVAAVDAVNASQPARAAARLAAAFGGSLEGRRIALLGLAFKADTDDIRDSPALALAAILRREGAHVVACDPQAADLVRAQEPWIELADGPMEAATDADATILATEWPEYVTMDLRGLAGAMRGALLLDARNAFDPSHVVGAGLTYMGVGRPGGRPEAQLS